MARLGTRIGFSEWYRKTAARTPDVDKDDYLARQCTPNRLAASALDMDPEGGSTEV